MGPRETFKYYVAERYKILQLKNDDAGKPWTDDPILQRNYFCNVFREDDKVTKYLRTFQTQFVGTGNLMFWVVLSRLLNNPATIQRLQEDDGCREFARGKPHVRLIKRLLKQYRKEGNTLFNAAYIVSTAGKVMDKVEYVVQLATKVNTRYHSRTSCLAQYEDLVSIKGMGTFMAGQVIADYKNTPGTVLEKAPDWWTFVAQGPGSTKGLNYLNGREPAQNLNRNKFEVEIAVAANLVAEVDLPQMCYQDVQNNLCEFSKYMRVSLGHGRSKRRYQGV